MTKFRLVVTSRDREKNEIGERYHRASQLVSVFCKLGNIYLFLFIKYFTINLKESNNYIMGKT